MTVHVCVWICTRKLNLWLYSATGLTLKNAERGLWRENSPSWQSRSEEAQRRFVFVCTGESEACVQKAKQPLASQICFDWCIRSCCMGRARKGPGRSKTTKFLHFVLFSFTLPPLLSWGRWLPASHLYNQALHFYFIDRCYFKPRLEEYGLLFEPLGKIELHGRVIYARFC